MKSKAFHAYHTRVWHQKQSRFWCAALALLPALACAPSWAQLNDTGQAQCAGGASMDTCSTASAGQDGARGRDAQATAGQLAKAGAGAAGFDFTALGASGAATAPGGHECVADNVTGLVWSMQTLPALNWADASAITGYKRCGVSAGWRLPTRRELLSIVHRGASAPAIDGTYFPATSSTSYWSADAAAGGAAWAVDFNDGAAQLLDAAQPHAARLVAGPVNQAPTLTPGANIVVPREYMPGPATYHGWAKDISPGPAREAGQHLTAKVELLPLQPGDPKALVFDVPPALDPATGDLTFTIHHRIDHASGTKDDPTPERDQWYSSAGLARVRVTLQDDGGTANGGQDTAQADFTIFLDPAPKAMDVNIKHPWKAVCIPYTVGAMDVDTDPVNYYTWHDGLQWPFPTFEILSYPTKGFLTEYVSSRTPDGNNVIRFASQQGSFDYVLPKTGMVQVGTQAAAGKLVPSAAKSSTSSFPNDGIFMTPRPPRIGWTGPWSKNIGFNFSMTHCYVPFSSTFVGSDTFTYQVTDPDGNVSGIASVSIEIFEIK